MFVIGADHDTLESIDETVDFAIDNEITSVQFLVITPLPGTRQYDALRAGGPHLHPQLDPVRRPPRGLPAQEHESVGAAAGHAGQPPALLSAPPPARRRRSTAPWASGSATVGRRVPENMAFMRELRAFSDALDMSSILTDGVRDLVRS